MHTCLSIGGTTKTADLAQPAEVIMAAALLYKGYLIVSHAKQDTWSKRWSVTVDISSRVPDRPDNTIFTGDEFQTQEEAEQWGMQQARQWIDQQG